MKKVFFFHKCLLPLLKKEKRKILMHIMDEVIPISEKSKYNFLQHHELDSEEKIENKNPFDFDKSGNCLICNETGYKIFAPKINNEVGKDKTFVNTLNYAIYQYIHIFL